MLDYRKSLKNPSQRLRREMTDAEKLLWSKIRNDQINGYRFYRQKPVGNYITDFFCPKAKLVVEVDGGQHYEIRGEMKDKARDEYFKGLGLKVLRFPNTDVLKNIDGVIGEIQKNLPQPLFFKEGSRKI